MVLSGARRPPGGGSRRGRRARPAHAAAHGRHGRRRAASWRCSRAGCSASTPRDAAGLPRRRRAPGARGPRPAAARGRRGGRRRRRAVPGAGGGLLPDRHRARGAPGATPRTGSCASTAWSTARSTLDFADLLAAPLVERDGHADAACPTRSAATSSATPAGWAADRRRCCAEAGPHADADMVLSTSVDGFTAATPLDGAHRRPRRAARGRHERRAAAGRARLPGAAWWCPASTATCRRPSGSSTSRSPGSTARRRYWTPRGWSASGRRSRPSPASTCRATAPACAPGAVAVAGVAWAQHRGIDRRARCGSTTGPWQDARLGAEASIDTWRQWVYAWDATPGRHVLQVRATDGEGAVQTGEQAPPEPDGATGWHTVTVTVS